MHKADPAVPGKKPFDYCILRSRYTLIPALLTVCKDPPDWPCFCVSRSFLHSLARITLLRTLFAISPNLRSLFFSTEQRVSERAKKRKAKSEGAKVIKKRSLGNSSFSVSEVQLPYFLSRRSECVRVEGSSLIERANRVVNAERVRLLSFFYLQGRDGNTPSVTLSSYVTKF